MESKTLRPAITPAAAMLAVRAMTDEYLEARLQRLAWIERKALVALLVHLAEFDGRRLYADRGHPSLFAYCTRVLGYSEQGAYKRIQAARAVREHPALLEHLASGHIHLAAIVVLAPHLRPDNADGLLNAARGKSIRELERIAAGLSPRPDVADSLRALPRPPLPALAAGACEASAQTSPPAPSPSPDIARLALPALRQDSPRDLLEALSSERSLFRFACGMGLRDKYQRAQALLRLKPRTGAMEIVFERALDMLLDRLDPERRHARRQERGAVARPPRASRTRAIPAAVRDAVWARDASRCTFMGPEGDRCTAASWLEIDHILPFARGGRSDDPTNLRLTCKTHNLLLARRVFGKAAIRNAPASGRAPRRGP